MSALPGIPTNLLGSTRGELEAQLAALVDHSYRFEQVFRALHERRCRTLADVSDLPSALRQELALRFTLARPVTERHVSSRDGTCKFLMRLRDGATIEAVDIPEARRRTLCISSQAGCALGCTFCVTGFWGAGRNLAAHEIVGQVYAILEDETRAEHAPLGLNLVLMGMGEPLLNLEGVRPALEILSDRLSWRRITVSTAGVVPGILELAVWPQRPNLAISLHAPDDERRSALMPLNRRYPITELLAALRRYPLERGRRLTFEYTLIDGVNDRPADPRLLARLLHGLRAKVNLIPLNPDPVLPHRPAPWPRVYQFRDELARRGVVCTVRRPRGDDVAAACGQLRAFGRPPQPPRAAPRARMASR